MFSTLPLEVLQKIGNETVRIRDRKSLRRTCSLFGHAFKPHVLTEVTLNIHAGNLQAGVSLLKALVKDELEYQKSGNSTLFKYIRTLYIDTISPTFLPRCPDSDLDPNLKLRKLYDVVEVEDQVECWVRRRYSIAAYMAERKLGSLLGPALKCLRRLDTVRWRWKDKDSEWVLNTVLKALSNSILSRNIIEFSFDYRPSKDKQDSSPVPLPDLQNLQILSISGNVSETVFSILLQHPLISQSSLTTLHLFRLQTYDVFFTDLTLDTFPSTISNLATGGLYVPPQIFSIGHGNLTSLEIRNTINFAQWFTDSLVKVLLSQRIFIRRLNVSCTITDPLFNYMGSYSGLEVLSLSGSVALPEEPSQHSMYISHTADCFYENILPKHKNTLVKLEVMLHQDNRWCFGVNNIEAFRECRRLRSLGVSVSLTGLDQVPPPDFVYDSRLEPVNYPNSVHLLFGMISSSMLDLEQLIIEPVHNNRYQTAGYDLWMRERLYSSMKSFAHKSLSTGGSGHEVFKWVKVYIGNKTDMKRVVIGQVKMRELSHWRLLI